jgi:hypothetical protein
MSGDIRTPGTGSMRVLVPPSCAIAAGFVVYSIVDATSARHDTALEPMLYGIIAALVALFVAIGVQSYQSFNRR